MNDPLKLFERIDRFATKATIALGGALGTGVLAWLGMGMAASIVAIAAVGLLYIVW